MLVDFCHWVLQPNVTCDKPSSDGYEVQNLVSREPSLKRTGFLASNFIKPPVNITFCFPCKVSIHQIIINPTIGAQKSTHIEIYTSCKRVTSSWLVSEATESDTRGKLSFDSPMFMNIGKVNVKDSSMVCFTYPRFTATSPYSVERLDLDGYIRCELRNPRYQYMTAISQLTIRLVQTRGSSVPAVKSVQIFGQPAVSNTKEVLQKVHNVFWNSIAPSIVKQVKTTPQTQSKDVTETNPGLQIPEEFLDPITCDIMALPVLLPCGKSLDQFTLEKYISTESSWGRSANDPFTGVTFTAESRPIPNDSLKARIDAFLFKNAGDENIKFAPRTVGRSEGSCERQTSQSDIQASASSLTLNKPQKRILDLERENVSNQNFKKARTKKIKKFESVEKPKSLNAQNPQPSTSQSKGENSQTPTKPTHGVSHLHQLNNSLSEAMSLLSGLPSFTKKAVSEVKDDETFTKHCRNCESLLDQSTAAYSLQCGHVICRQCLLKPGSSRGVVSCRLCQKTCKSSEATRVHVV